MRPVAHCVLCVFFAGVLLVSAGCVQGQPDQKTSAVPAPVSPAHAVATKEELVAFVDSAVAYAHAMGKERALAEFNNRIGPFVSGDRYIFAYDYNGTTLALPYQPELLGTNRMAIVDAQGVRFIEEMAGTARGGSGFVDYLYPNPARNFSVQKKTSYVVDADGTWFLGSGMYSARS
jgi:hypothetical protein